MTTAPSADAPIHTRTCSSDVGPAPEGPHPGQCAWMAVGVLLRTATVDDTDLRDRELFDSTLRWAVASPWTDGVGEWLVRALYWAGWEMDWSGQEVSDEDVLEAAASVAYYPGVTPQHMAAVMGDARADPDAPAFIPQGAVEMAAVATLTAVWLRDLTLDDEPQDELIDRCVAETSPV